MIFYEQSARASGQIISTRSHHPLQDVAEPNLCREMFPYSEIGMLKNPAAGAG